MSLWRDGIPDRFMTPVGAATVGLLVAGMFIVFMQVRSTVRYYATEPTQAPLCYRAHNGVHVPGSERIPARTRDRSDVTSIDHPPASYEPETVLLAQRACAPDGCSRAAWETYRSKISRYVLARIRHTTALDRRFGDAGLKRARDIYDTAQDLSIEKHLRDLYVAGVFRINDFRERRDALTILIFRGGRALQPCRGDAPEQDSAVSPQFRTKSLRGGLS